MKRQISLSLVLTLTVLLPLMSLPSTAQAQQSKRFRVDSGFLTPNTTQILRVTVVNGGGDDTTRARFVVMNYFGITCSGVPQVCQHTVASQTATAPLTLNGDEAASLDVQGTAAGVRIVVEGNSRNARVTFQVIDTTTGKVDSFFVNVEA
jgi:hypothetical protein